MTRKTLQKLQVIAKKLGKEVFSKYENPNGGVNDFTRFDYNNNPKEELMSGGKIRYHFNESAYITFDNIRPNEVNKITYGTPSIRNEKIEDVNTVNLYNNTDEKIIRTYKFNKESETTMETNLSAAIKSSITQEISAGGAIYGIESKTSVSLEISASVSKNMSKTDSISTEDILEIPVKKRSRVELVSRRSISDFEQIITSNCSLDFDIRGESKDDYDVKYTSLKDLQDNLYGTAYPGDKDTFKRWMFGRRDNLDLTELLGDYLNTDLETPIKFSNATTGDVNANQYDL